MLHALQSDQSARERLHLRGSAADKVYLRGLRSVGEDRLGKRGKKAPVAAGGWTRVTSEHARERPLMGT